MWDLATIKYLNQKVGEEARLAGKEPLRLMSESALEKWPPFPVPHLGEACEDVDEDYTRLETLFVDSSGFGSDDEPALSMRQFKVRVQELFEEHGPLLLAIEEQGQFQLYVAVWSAGGD